MKNELQAALHAVVAFFAALGHDVDNVWAEITAHAAEKVVTPVADASAPETVAESAPVEEAPKEEPAPAEAAQQESAPSTEEVATGVTA